MSDLAAAIAREMDSRRREHAFWAYATPICLRCERDGTEPTPEEKDGMMLFCRYSLDEPLTDAEMQRLLDIVERSPTPDRGAGRRR